MESRNRQASENIAQKREARRSFVLGVLNGTIFNFAETLIDPPLVLTWFVSQLTTSNLLRGLVAPLGEACWFLPQIFVSTHIQRMRRKMPSYVLSAIIRSVAWILLAITVWFVDNPPLLLIGFFVLYTAARLSAGLAGLAFLDVVAKTIPARRRGSFFTTRLLFGSILGLGGGWIVKTVLHHPALPFPRDHALLFTFYCVAMVPGLVSFMLIREPPGAAVTERVTVGEQLRRAWRLLRQDGVYRRYMLSRVSLTLANIAIPFYGIYAKEALGAPEWMVGVYVTARTGALLLSNPPWGRLSDRRGNRIVMRLLGLGNGMTVVLALALMGGMALFRPQGEWLPYLALPLFFLAGAVAPAKMLSGSNFLLELVPEPERPLYLGFSNTLMSAVAVASGLGGLLVDSLGFGGLFAVSLGLCLIGYVFATGLPEPREAAS
jgi:MFS family permease